jgi:hypothetical protein
MSCGRRGARFLGANLGPPASSQLGPRNRQHPQTLQKSAIQQDYLPRYNPVMMRWRLSKTLVSLERTASEFLDRIQHPEAEQAELRARLQGRAAAQETLAICRVSDAPDGANPFSGDAKAGARRGLARARQVVRLRERWSETGQFMAHFDREVITQAVEEAKYMRYAASGFARVASARRGPNGTF